MHDAFIIVRDAISIDHLPVVFLEVEAISWSNVLLVDTNIIISVRTSLFVMESQSVSELMSHDSRL